MATSKPKKSAKSATSSKPKKAAPKTAKSEKSAAVATKTKTVDQKNIFKGFFARKFDANENILTIFKSPKIYGALLGEVIGTMLLSMLLLTLGLQPLYIVFAVLGITIVVFALSGANLNPLITVGMMASRRMSAIRGILYILAQILGAWIGLLIVNAFRLSSGTTYELPAMAEVGGEFFWAVTMIEFLGACIIGFFFARALTYKRSAFTFAAIVSAGVTLAVIIGLIISQTWFSLSDNFIFNPAIALMYQILPSSAADFGELMSGICLALTTYAIFPMLGGVIGFYVSDFASRLVGEKNE